MSEVLSRLEIEQENYVKCKWVLNIICSAKSLDGIDCDSCTNHIRVKKQFYDEKMDYIPYWIETGAYCKLKIIPDMYKRCKHRDYGNPRVKYVRLQKK